MIAENGWALLGLSGVLDVIWGLPPRSGNWGLDVVSLTLLAAFVFTCSKALVSCLWELPMRCGQDWCGRIGGSRHYGVR